MLSPGACPLIKIQGKQIKLRERRSDSPQSSTPAADSDQIPSSDSVASPPPLPRAFVNSVVVPQSKRYIPRTEPPKLLPLRRPEQDWLTEKFDLRWQKTILHRFQTENGGMVFALGTKFASTVTRDTEDVPASCIHTHVTSAELSRFENAAYEEEAEKERIRILTMRPRGRPKKQPDGMIISASDLPPQKPPSQSQELRPGGYAAFREAGQPRKRGRPLGWTKRGVHSQVNTRIPSFNGPQPTGDDTPSGTDQSFPGRSRQPSISPDETPMDVQARTGVYSMVAASGLVPIDCESELEACREITPLDPLEAEFNESDSVTKSETSHEATPLGPVEADNSKMHGLAEENRIVPIPERFVVKRKSPSSPLLTEQLSERQASVSASESTSSEHHESQESPDEEQREALLQRFLQSQQPQQPYARSHVIHSSAASSSLHPSKAVKALTPHAEKPSKSPSRLPISSVSNTSLAPKSVLPFIPRPIAAPEIASARQTPGKKRSLTPHFPSGSRKIRRISNISSARSPLSSQRVEQPPRLSTPTPKAIKPTPAYTPSPISSTRFVRREPPDVAYIAGRTLPLLPKSTPQHPTPRHNPPAAQINDIENAIAISSEDRSTDSTDADSSVDAFAGVSPPNTTNIDPRLVAAAQKRGVSGSSSDDTDDDDDDDDDSGEEGDESDGKTGHGKTGDEEEEDSEDGLMNTHIVENQQRSGTTDSRSVRRGESDEYEAGEESQESGASTDSLIHTPIRVRMG